MAKQLVNPFERHVEKIVLGIAGVLLLGAVARYLVTTPNQIELGGELVTPSTIDRKVAAKAADVRVSIANSRPPTIASDPLRDEFVTALDPFSNGTLSRQARCACALGPKVPVFERGSVVADTDLVEVVRLPKPLVSFGRSTLRLGDQESVRYQPSDWVTVSSAFPREEQAQRQRILCGSHRAKVVFGPPALQRRAQRLDGTWSDDDWEAVQPWPIGSLPNQPRISLIEQDGEMIAPAKAITDVERFFNILGDADRQLDLIRPLLPPIANGDYWEFPVITTVDDVLWQDDELWNPKKRSSGSPKNRYFEDEAVATDPDEVSSADQMLADLGRAEALIQSALANLDVNDTTRAYNIAFDIAGAADAPGTLKSRAKKIMVAAELAGGDIQRLIIQGRRPGGKQPASDENSKRELLPTQQVWAHDAQPGSVVNGQTYQYRIRATIMNRLAAQPRRLENPLGAERLMLSGDWSEPSDPVYIAPAAHYFVMGVDQRDARLTATIELFQWFEGVWIKTRAKLGVGEPVTKEGRHPVPAIDDSGSVDNAMVTFKTDVALVDIEPDRSFRPRERGRGGRKTGVVFGQPSPALSVVFMDAGGRLHERFMLADKDDPARKAAAGRVWRPGKPTRQPRRTPAPPKPDRPDAKDGKP